MANNHDQFIAFNDTIKITKSTTEGLRTNRSAIREKIRNYFYKNWSGKVQPKFHWQGAFSMHTTLNPIKDDEGLGVYDMDDGVYFIGRSQDEREKLEWYHSEVLAAVKDHTSTGAKDNDPCVTVLYADGHHVDLPIYFMVECDKHPKLAHRANSWMDSDPRELTHWFNGKAKDYAQLRRIVRYLKAWCNYIYEEKGIKMPTGCIMTILAERHFIAHDSRDDLAMKDVLVAIYEELSAEDGFHCYRPTFPKGEDLFENYAETRKNEFLKQLKSFKEDAERAIANKKPREACLKWQKHLGDRFCCSTAKDEDEDAQKKEFSGTLNTNSRFA